MTTKNLLIKRNKSMKKLNIVLDNEQREAYAHAIGDLKALCPETTSRKIPEANIQQAFIYDTVKMLVNKDDSILSVGCFEDTAYEALLKNGYPVVGIDSAVNVPLKDFCIATDKRFDVVFSTSVIEHVEDDEIFIHQICRLLNVDGYGVLTCDFNNNYKEGDPKPSCDYRLYTSADLLGRLYRILRSNGCELYGDVDYSASPDFYFEGVNYSFATYVFKKVIL